MSSGSAWKQRLDSRGTWRQRNCIRAGQGSRATWCLFTPLATRGLGRKGSVNATDAVIPLAKQLEGISALTVDACGGAEVDSQDPERTTDDQLLHLIAQKLQTRRTAGDEGFPREFVPNACLHQHHSDLDFLGMLELTQQLASRKLRCWQRHLHALRCQSVWSGRQ